MFGNIINRGRCGYKKLLVAFCLFMVAEAHCQIFKVPTTDNAVYRISHKVLQDFGLNPKNLHISHRGLPQDFKNDGNFIEFLGKRNDGVPDSALYEPVSAQPHAYYSLFSDTTWFYLKNEPITLPRIVENPKTNLGQEHLKVFNSDYSFNSRTGPSPDLEQSYFESGEGFTGKMIRGDSLATYQVPTLKDSLRVTLLLHGRDKYARNVRIFVNSVLQKTIIWQGFQTSQYEFNYLPTSDTLRISTQAETGNRYSWGYVKIQAVGTLESVPTHEISKLFPVQTLNFDQLRGNYLIITHDKLLAAAQEYARYRAKKFDVLVLTVRQLYDTFTYGEKSPLALMRLVELLKKNVLPKHIFLIGQATSIFDARDSEKDLVPTIGFPASDNALLGKKNWVCSIGRLSATRPEQVLAYLNKVIEYEADEQAAWRRNILHLNGGKTLLELQTYRQILARQIPKIKDGVGGRVRSIQKRSIDETEKIDLSEQINQGVGLLSFLGHSSPIKPDLDFGYVSRPENNYRNRGKYPFLFFNGCGIGNVFYGGTPLSTDWLLAPEKGAIGVLAHSYTGFVEPLEVFTDAFYTNLLRETDKSIGEIHRKTIQQLWKPTQDAYHRANLDQMLLQGDPALVLFPKTENLLPKLPSKVRVSPNPSHEIVNFQIETEEYPEKLQIFNEWGILLHEIPITQSGVFELNWDSSPYTSGIYFYRLITPTQQIGGRFLVF